MSQGQRKGWRYDQATGYLYVYVDGVAAAYFNDSSPYLTIASGLTVTSGGLTVTAGGLTVTAGGLTVTAGALTVTAGAVTITAGDVAIGNGYGLIIGNATQETISTGDGATDLVPEVQVLGTAQADGSLMLGVFNTTDTVAATLALVKGGNAAIGSHTTVADNEYVGRIIAFGDDGTDLESPVAEIRFVINGTPGTGDMPGSIEFYTTADGGETLTLALTLEQNQKAVFAGDVSIAGNVSHTAGKFISGSPQKLTITEKADSATLTAAEAGVIVVTVDAKTMTLPAVSGNAGLRYIVKVECTHSSGTVVDGSGSETIDGATTKTSGAQFDVLDIICDGDEWHIVGRIGTWS